MRWIRKTDRFLLTRSEVADLFLFDIAWMHEPKSKRPCGYAEFHKGTLIPLDRLLRRYLKYVKVPKPKRK